MANPPKHLLSNFIAPSTPLKDLKPIFTDPGKWLKHYLSKWRGTEIPSVGTPAPSLTVLIYSWLGAFIGITCVAMIAYEAKVPAIIGSFGASAVLIYGAIESPLAQPKNFFGGQVISAFWGVCVAKMMEAGGMTPLEQDWKRALAAAGAVSGALLFMQLTRTTHPPGGATALIAVSIPQPCSPQPCFTPWTYIIWPVALGCAVMLLVSLLIENLGARRYPVYWWAPYRKPVAVEPAAPVGIGMKEQQRKEEEGENGQQPSGEPEPEILIEDNTDAELRARQLEEEKEVAGGEDVSPGVEFEELERELASYGDDLDRRASRASLEHASQAARPNGDAQV